MYKNKDTCNENLIDSNKSIIFTKIYWSKDIDKINNMCTHTYILSNIVQIFKLKLLKMGMILIF